MKPTVLIKPLPWILVAVGVVLLVGWLRVSANSAAMEPRLPGADRIGITLPPVKKVDLRGEFFASRIPRPDQPDNPAPDLSGSWPCFRGSKLDGISYESLPLLHQFPAAGPPRLWTVPMGEGYASPAVHNGRLYVLDYDQPNQADVLRCLTLEGGQEIWRRSYKVEVKRNHGMSRTMPAVTDQYVVTLGPKCHVLCVDAKSGDFRWGLDLVADYNTKIPPWYAGQCPLIDQDRVLLAPGGKSLMIAVDLASGKILWEAPNPLGWDMTHVCITPMTFAGQKMYLYCGTGGVAGISAADGKILWQTALWKINMAMVPTPLVLEEGRIFLCGGYGVGAMMLQLHEKDGKISAEMRYKLKPEVFGSEQQTPLYYKGYIFGVIPNGQFVCLNPADGRQVWNSGSRRFGIGPYLIADGVIYVLNDTGTLSIIEATPESFRLLAQASVIEHGHEAWGPMALVAGRLIVRDMTRMVCLDIKENGHDGK